MVQSISTYGLYSVLARDSNAAQSALVTATEQEATGLISETYSGLGGVASSKLLSLQSSVTQADNYAANAVTTGTVTQTMYTAVGNMISSLTSLKTALSAAESGSSNPTLSSTAESILTDLASEMNTQLGSDYVFSGDMTDTAPVDLTNYPAIIPVSATTADTSYYRGDDSVASVQVGSDQSISYGVTADNSSFEEALRAAAMAVEAVGSGGSTDATTVQSAFALASTALDDLSDLQEEISNSSSRLKDVETNETAFVSQMNNMITDTEGVDTAQASANVSEYQTQLEASYSALAIVLKVRLTDYLS
jgi:flagellar hook-associated protein 3 FlgL